MWVFEKIFLFIFHKIKYENYLVFGDGNKTKIRIKSVPNTFYINKKYYGVVNTTDEIINKFLIRRWIKIEEIY